MRSANTALILAALVAMVPGAAAALTLDEAIAAAREHAPALARADAMSRVTEGAYRVARAGARPAGVLEGSVGVARLDPQQFFGLSAADTTPRSAAVSIEQPIYAGGAISGPIAAARADRAAARAGIEAVQAELVAEVVRAYADVVVGGRRIAQYRGLETDLVEVARQARLKFQAGEVPSTDMAQAEARLAEARAGISQVNGALAVARAHFRTLTGLEANDLAPFPAPPPTPIAREAAVAQALANNPSLARAQAAVEGADARARASGAEGLPKVTGFARVSTTRDQFFPGYAADEAVIGVRARWTFLDGGRAAGQRSEARAQRDIALADLRAAQDAVTEAAISGFEALRTAGEVRIAARAQDDASRRALHDVRLEVQAGAKPQLALLDTERDAIAAATRAAAADANVLIAAYSLRAVLGEQ
jgi:outer membrane protein